MTAQHHADYYRSILDRADALYLQGGPAVAERLSLFDRERTNIEAGQRCAAAQAMRSDKAVTLAASYADHGTHVVELKFHAEEWIGWNKPVLESARRIGDRRGEGRALGHIGVASVKLGNTT